MLLLSASKKDREASVAVGHEIQPVLDARERLPRPDREVHEIWRTDADPELMCDVEEIRQ